MKMRSTLYGSPNPEGREMREPNANQRQFEEDLVKENEAILSALGSTVNRMKTSAGTLHEEAREQNKLLDTIESAFANARSGVKRSVMRIDGVMGRYGLRHTLFFGVFVFIALFGLYYILK